MKNSQNITVSVCRANVYSANIRRAITAMVLVSLLACSSPPPEPQPTDGLDQAYLRGVVGVLSEDIGPRNFRYLENLNKTKMYIAEQFKDMGYTPVFQKYTVRGRVFANVVISLGPSDAPLLVVGAHYDTYNDTPGADDNASGIAGLLLLARKLKSVEHTLKKRIELVAYTLEEPPFFRSTEMGSFVHAANLHKSNANVIGMICLEMIGYFSEKQGTQSYPLGFMKLVYPSEGDFIGVVSNFGSGNLKSVVKRGMAKAGIPVETLSAPKSVAGVDFSDHLNYWQFDYKAVMVSDTSFYRNPHYHELTDTIDSLDFTAMARVVEGVFVAALELADGEFIRN